MYTKEDIFNLVEEEDVRFIRLQFTDMYGTIKNMAITVSQLEKALSNRFSFDSSFVKGFESAGGAPLFLCPNLDTFQIFPWRPHQGKVARFICDVCDENGNHFKDDSRFILEKAVEEARALGYTFVVRPQCEFFLFKTDDDGEPMPQSDDKGSFFDVSPLDNGENCRRDIILSLEDMGFDVEASYHEKAPGQHEIELPAGTALEVADKIINFRMVVKTIAKRNGLHATFMAKPMSGQNGSGMHLGMTLLKDGENILLKDGKLSGDGKGFVAGLLRRAVEMACLTNPTVNSYKRLTPGHEAPCCVAWSENVSSSFIRIVKNGIGMIKLCSPDSMSNPYLVFAACLKAGIEGIRGGMTPPDMLTAEGMPDGAQRLPMSLREAVDIAKNSDFIKDILGENLHRAYIAEKEKEFDDYRKTVSKWELDRYFIQY